MAGNPDAARLWEGADFYTAPLGTEIPEFSDEVSTVAAWKPVGLLSEDGSSETRNDDITDHYAWGGILVRTTKSRHKRQITVTCLEDNLTVFGLVNPGSETSTAGAVNRRTVKVPKGNRVSFFLELRDGDITRRRHIHSGEVESVGEVSLSDSALTAYALTITIYPDADGVLYDDYDNDPNNAVDDAGDVGENVEDGV